MLEMLRTAQVVLLVALLPTVLIVLALSRLGGRGGATPRNGRIAARPAVVEAPHPGLVQRIRARPDLITWLVGVAGGVQLVPAFLWTPISGFLVDDLDVSPRAAGDVANWAFAGHAVGVALILSAARKFDDRKLTFVLALAGAAVTVVPALAPDLGTITVAAFVAAPLAVGIHVVLPPLLARSPGDRRGRASGQLAAAWIVTISTILVVEPLVAARWGWQAVCLGQAALGALTAPVMLLPPRDSRPREERSLRAIWLATLGQLRKARMRAAFAIAFLSGGAFGLFHSTYSPMLALIDQATWAWAPALAFYASFVFAPLWGRASDRRPRGTLLWAAVVTAFAFLVGGVQLMLPVAVVWLLLAIQALVVEVGTTGTTVVGPPLLLEDKAGEEQLAVLQTGKFAGMFCLGLLGTALILVAANGLAVNAVGLLASLMGIAVARLIPLGRRRAMVTP